MPDLKLVAPFEPTGDQPAAIDRLVDGLQNGLHHQVLLGATGTGKTFSIASVIAQVNRPTLVLAHNKTLAAQLYAEFREFFPDNAVEQREPDLKQSFTKSFRRGCAIEMKLET